MIGKPLGDQRAELALDLEVDLGDEIDRALLVDAHRAAEVRHLHVAGADDRLDGGREKDRRERRQAPRRQLLHHAHFHAAFRRAPQHDVVHEAAHEEDAAAARLQDVLGRQRVGDLLGVEALTLVEDADDELVRVGRPART